MRIALITFEGFIWDIHNLHKIANHGVIKEDVESLFSPNIYIFRDGSHSWSEDRLIGIGKEKNGRYIFVSYTHRTFVDKIFIRVITARFMHNKERDQYEKSKNSI